MSSLSVNQSKVVSEVIKDCEEGNYCITAGDIVYAAASSSCVAMYNLKDTSVTLMTGVAASSFLLNNPAHKDLEKAASFRDVANL